VIYNLLTCCVSYIKNIGDKQVFPEPVEEDITTNGFVIFKYYNLFSYTGSGKIKFPKQKALNSKVILMFGVYKT
jgi:hypothetical protein